MIFREWFPGQPMIKGTFNIDVPDTKSRVLIPNILLVPTLGFNQKNFRLGYGEDTMIELWLNLTPLL